MYKVLIADNVSDEGIRLLLDAPEFEVSVRKGISAEELLEEIPAYHALIVRSRTQVTKEVLEAGEKLKVIGRAGVGVDNIDLEAATSRGVVVVNAPEGNTISTAEHTVALMMALSRHIPQANQSLKEGRWDRKKFLGTELTGKVLGIIGFGRVGSTVARIAQGLNMQVLAYDPYITEERARDMGVTAASLEEIFAQADYITVHTPKTPETENLINKETLAKMKDGVRIINCARGGIVNQEDLVEALRSGKVAGAALDVFPEEPPKDYGIFATPNLIATPHLGASTVEAQVNVAVDVIKEVMSALRGEPITNAVNMPVLRPEAFAKVKPFLSLAERLGKFTAQLLPGAIESVSVAYSGQLTEFNVSPLTTAVLKGLFRPAFGSEVNSVNAPYLARKRGIKVTESKQSNGNYSNLIQLEVQTDKGTRKMAATLFAENQPRIVQIGDYHIDAIPEGYLLVTRHKDRPGIIGAVGTILGDAEINIASMQLGRSDAGGEAVMVLGVDQPIPPKVLKKLVRYPDIDDVYFVRL
ncbi:MAG: phosphoglycerate dehydrogenase [Firmicutes bacterium]|nr:phosphoglycerate dehydrogenase [Bacillota bacterium]